MDSGSFRAMAWIHLRGKPGRAVSGHSRGRISAVWPESHQEPRMGAVPDCVDPPWCLRFAGLSSRSYGPMALLAKFLGQY